MKKLFSLICITLLFTLSVSTAWAQDGADADLLFSQSTNDLVVVTAWAATGALLGLSTLSFLDDPWSHSKNILVGFSIGTVIGVGFVAFFHANRSEEYYENADGVGGSFRELSPSKDFDTTARVGWHNQNFQSFQTRRPENIPFWYSRF